MRTSENQVLESVSVKGHLRGLCLELEVTQAFVNSSDRNIEAIYTFPLPFGAVLLDLIVKLGDKVLTGSVVAKKQAERDYEDAITEGNSAIMLERADDGICTINVGNLLAGERAELRYRFSQLLNWQQDTLRITLPTTMAPRYGDSAKAGWQPHQVTEHSLFAEYPFNLELDIEHPLSTAMLECPSHEVNITRQDQITNITLAGKQTWLDRDFILNITQQNTDKDAGQFAPDGEKHVALASFYPKIPSTPISSVCIKVVVDCSGSMAGDSIEQARVGLLRILDNLRETDTFNIVRFGNSARAYFPKCVYATHNVLNQAREAIETMEADLGGTEMAGALKFAYDLKDEGERPAAILLITDGEVYQHEDIVREAKKSKHRIFTVGVGSSVAESFVRNIATITGGAAELVSPNEEMAATIFRQFNRMFQQRAISTDIQWPSKPSWQSPKTMTNVFAGDTLHLFAGFDEQPTGIVSLKVVLENGQTVEQHITLHNQAEASKELARIATAHRIELMDTARSEEQATALAVEYQLISKHTNYLIIEERNAEEKPSDLPELAQVPHMMAAGYGGTGRISNRKKRFSKIADYDSAPVYASMSRCAMKMSMVEEYDMPAFLRKQVDDVDYQEATPRAPSTIDNISGSIKNALTPKSNTPIAAVVAVIESNNWYQSYQDNVYNCLSSEVAQVMNILINENGWAEKTVVAALLMAMLQKLDKVIPRHDMRTLIVALKAENPPQSLVNYLSDGLNLKNKSKNWGWDSAIELLPMS